MTPPTSLRVLVFAFDLDHESGWGHLSLETARAVREQGHEVKVVTPVNASVEADVGLCVSKLLWAPRFDKARLSWFPVNPVQLRRLVRWSDVVHVTVEPLSILAILAARGSRPVVQTGVGSYSVVPFRRGGLSRLAFARAWRKLARVVAISNFTAERIRSFHPGVPMEVAIPGIRIPRDRRRRRAAWKSPATILSVAAVKKRKGLQNLVEGFALYHREHPRSRLLIAGRIENEGVKERLLGRVSAHGLDGAVTILGQVSEATLDHLYSESQVFALTPVSGPFNFEGFGLVFLEANSYGLPVVGSTGCGAEDAIADGQSGLLVAPDDPRALAGAFKALLESPERWSRLSSQAWRHAEEHSWSAYGRRLDRVYRKLVEGSRPVRV